MGQDFPCAFGAHHASGPPLPVCPHSPSLGPGRRCDRGHNTPAGGGAYDTLDLIWLPFEWCRFQSGTESIRSHEVLGPKQERGVLRVALRTQQNGPGLVDWGVSPGGGGGACVSCDVSDILLVSFGVI